MATGNKDLAFKSAKEGTEMYDVSQTPSYIELIAYYDYADKITSGSAGVLPRCWYGVSRLRILRIPAWALHVSYDGAYVAIKARG